MLKKFEKFAEIYPKNKWVRLSLHDKDYLKDELFAIVHNAYSPIGGHVRIINPDSVITDKNLVYWTATDIDYDPEADIVIFCKKTKFGNKVSGWGHDGEKNSKQKLIQKLSELLKKPGYFVEISGKAAEQLDKLNVPFINNNDQVQMLFPNSEIIWYGKNPEKMFDYFAGFYRRTLENGEETDVEIVLGNPNF